MDKHINPKAGDTLVFRKMTPELRKKLEVSCNRTIDFLLKDLKLEEWEAYFVIKFLCDGIPVTMKYGKIEGNEYSSY